MKTISQQPIPSLDLQQLKAEFKAELNDILDWWSRHMVDEERGGFHGRMDGHGRLAPAADKGIILNTRLLWTYSAAALTTGKAEHRRLADRAYDYLCQYFWDEVEGGVLWMVDAEGNPVDTQKQIYGQAFAIYALCEYYFLSKCQEVLEKATELFWLIEKYSLDRDKNGYLSAFARDWSPMADIRLSEKDANEAKIMNTHLHLLEAYTTFYRVKPFAALETALVNVVDLFRERFFMPATGSLQVYFDENWIPKGDSISYGHNIEASWLLWEATEVLDSADQRRNLLPVCIALAEVVLEKAVDEDGAIMYEAGPEGLRDTDKHWWPQTEAVVGFWNAWQLTGRPEFAEASALCWAFTSTHLRDQEAGEWHWRTDRSGVPVRTEDKAGPWKAPYHNARMCLEMLKRLG